MGPGRCGRTRSHDGSRAWEPPAVLNTILRSPPCVPAHRTHTHIWDDNDPTRLPFLPLLSLSLSFSLSTHTVVHSNLNVTTFRSPAIRYHLLLCSSALRPPSTSGRGGSFGEEGRNLGPSALCSFFVHQGEGDRAVSSPVGAEDLHGQRVSLRDRG